MTNRTTNHTTTAAAAPQRARRRATRTAGPTGPAGVVDRSAGDEVVARSASPAEPAHVAAAVIERADPTPPVDVDDGGVPTLDVPTLETSAGRRGFPRWIMPAAAVIVILTPAAVLGRLDWHASDRADLRDQYIATARQTVLNMTTIHGDTVAKDLRQVANGSGGEFQRELNANDTIDKFARLIQAARVAADGVVLDAGLESTSGHDAKVLVAAVMTVKRVENGDSGARDMRFEVTVHNDGDGTMAVTNLESVS